MAVLRGCLLALVVTTTDAGFLQVNNATAAIFNQEERDEKDQYDSFRGLKVANAQAHSSYSKHACHGAHNGKQTCSFQNVCYDLVSDTRRLLYFYDPQNSEYQNARDTEDMSALDLRPLSQEANPAVHLDIHKVSGPIPAEAAIYPHAVTVLFQPFGAENFGHELGDDMYAAFAMQQLFRIADPYNSQVLTLDRCDRKEVDGANRSACIGMMAKLYPALSRHPVLQMRALDLLTSNGVRAVAHQKAKLMCFPLLLAGSGTYSFRSPIVSGQSYFAYRSFLLHNMCASGACDGAAPERKTILIAKKTKFSDTGMGAGIPNTKELQDHLRHSFPKYDVQLRDLAHLSFKDQAALLARTSVMFSHCGGGSFSALFLPRGAVLAVQTKGIVYPMAYWVDKEINFWQSLDWLTFFNVQVDLTPVLAQRVVVRSLAKTQEHKPQEFKEATDFSGVKSWMVDHMKEVEARTSGKDDIDHMKEVEARPSVKDYSMGRIMKEMEHCVCRVISVSSCSCMTKAIPEKTSASFVQGEDATDLDEDGKVEGDSQLMDETGDSSEEEDEQDEEEGSEVSEKEVEASRSEEGEETEAIQNDSLD